MKKYWVYLGSLISMIASVSPALADETKALLPLGRSWVGDQNLPLPYGIGADYYYQRQPYDIQSMKLTPPVGMPLNQQLLGALGILQNQSVASTLQVRTRVNEGDVKADAWLFPFLNVFVLGGYVREHTTVTGFPPAASQLIQQATMDENGDIFGGGMTLAGSIGRLWGSAMIAETYASLNNNDSWIRAWVVSPKVGVQLDGPWSGGEKSLNVWVGGMFQRADENHSGTMGITLPGSPAPVSFGYNVKIQEAEAWNFLFGGSVNLCQHWQASVEAGVGQRQQVNASLGYRF